MNQVRHHALLAHGLAVQSIRANAHPGTQVGLAENPSVFVPVIETPAHIEAALRATRQENAKFLTAVMEGAYTDSYLAQEGSAAPRIEPGDMKVIGSPLDFIGLNVYTPEYVRADSSPAGYSIEPRPSSYPHMASAWLYLGPEVIYWAVRNVTELWKPQAIYITENGCSAADTMKAEGRVEDIDRVMYLRNHVTHLQRAVSERRDISSGACWTISSGPTDTTTALAFTMWTSSPRSALRSSALNGIAK